MLGVRCLQDWVVCEFLIAGSGFQVILLLSQFRREDAHAPTLVRSCSRRLGLGKTPHDFIPAHMLLHFHAMRIIADYDTDPTLLLHYPINE